MKCINNEVDGGLKDYKIKYIHLMLIKVELCTPNFKPRSRVSYD